MPPGSYGSSRDDNRSFAVFLEGWLIRQERFLNELLVAIETFDEESQESDMRDLISRVLAHYKEYYEEKSRMTHRNGFRVFSSPWFSPPERCFLWITGFNPGLVFNLVTSSVNYTPRHETKVQKGSQRKSWRKFKRAWPHHRWWN